MTTRRAFITGLLASAATGAAQACPAQPATVFAGARRVMVMVPARYVMSGFPPALLHWSANDGLTAWGSSAVSHPSFIETETAKTANLRSLLGSLA